MSRGFDMWNYMTYHLVHDYFKAKKKKKTEIQNFEVKNYKAAQKAAEQWIKSVRKFAESSYGVHYPKELYYGATQVLLAVCAEIYRYGCADTLDTLYSRGTIPPARLHW